MKPITIRNHQYSWGGALLLVLCTGAGVALECLAYVFLGIFLCVLFLAIGSQKTVVSAEGIEVWFLRWKTRYPWAQVIQAGIMDISHHGSTGPHLLVTLEGGRPKQPGQGFSDWLGSNPKGLKIPCIEGLRELVLACSGPLDFDCILTERKRK